MSASNCTVVNCNNFENCNTCYTRDFSTHVHQACRPTDRACQAHSSTRKTLDSVTLSALLIVSRFSITQAIVFNLREKKPSMSTKNSLLWISNHIFRCLIISLSWLPILATVHSMQLRTASSTVRCPVFVRAQFSYKKDFIWLFSLVVQIFVNWRKPKITGTFQL